MFYFLNGFEIIVFNILLRERRFDMVIMKVIGCFLRILVLWIFINIGKFLEVYIFLLYIFIICNFKFNRFERIVMYYLFFVFYFNEKKDYEF